MKNLTQAEIKQRQDAAALLQNALIEREEYVKIALRLENNLRTFVDRQNFELASLARTIAQKDENILTLKKMVDGFFVEPTAPIISQQEETAKRVNGGISPPPKEEPEHSRVTQGPPVAKEKVNGTNGTHVEAQPTPAKDVSDAEVAH